MSEQELKELIISLGGKVETINMPNGEVLYVYKLNLNKEEEKDETRNKD